MFGVFFFFFQAEDGIRDLVRSRGLGDVYKRQGHACQRAEHGAESPYRPTPDCGENLLSLAHTTASVSYTHLTLPTSDLV